MAEGGFPLYLSLYMGVMSHSSVSSTLINNNKSAHVVSSRVQAREKGTTIFHEVSVAVGGSFVLVSPKYQVQQCMFIHSRSGDLADPFEYYQAATIHVFKLSL